MRVTENRGEDERRLATAGAFVNIRSGSEQRADRALIAGAYRLG